MYLVIGANGRTGQHIVRHLRQQGDPVTAFIRSESQADKFRQWGAQIYLGDLDHDFSAAFSGAHTVIYAAGSAEDQGEKEERAYDRDAIIATTDLAKHARIDCLAIISALTAFDPSRQDDALSHYRQMKFEGDEYVRKSGQSYLIIGPTTLTNDAAVGRIAIHDRQTGPLPSVTREDTALVTIAALKAGLRNRYIGFSGGDQAIGEALATL